MSQPLKLKQGRGLNGVIKVNSLFGCLLFSLTVYTKVNYLHCVVVVCCT